jgi:hypothetical protein
MHNGVRGGRDGDGYASGLKMFVVMVVVVVVSVTTFPSPSSTPSHIFISPFLSTFPPVAEIRCFSLAEFRCSILAEFRCYHILLSVEVMVVVVTVVALL